MDTLTQTFDERLQEIDAYLDLLDALERQVHDGLPRIGGAAITAQQQKILYSAVYLQLYNLVEATMTWCLEAVCRAAAKDGRWYPSDLTPEVRKEWVRTKARTHVNLTADKRLKATMELSEHLIKPLPISSWSIERRNSGSWDDLLIEDMIAGLGFTLQLSQDVIRGVKRRVRDDKGALSLIRDLRNSLAHGSLSFTECGDNVTAAELRQIKESTGSYLRAIIRSFCDHIGDYKFVVAARRPEAV